MTGRADVDASHDVENAKAPRAGDGFQSFDEIQLPLPATEVADGAGDEPIDTCLPIPPSILLWKDRCVPMLIAMPACPVVRTDRPVLM